jgi:hypothetical protein
MKNTVKLVLSMFLFCVFSFANAQGRNAAGVFKKGSSRTKHEGSVEFGPYLGAINYSGDLTNGFMPALNETGLAAGLAIKFNINTMWTFKTTALYGQISGNDANYSSDAFRNRRNLSFRSNMIEVSGQFEYNFRGYIQSSNMFSSTPYVFLGVSVFRHSPQAFFEYDPAIHGPELEKFDGEWINLQPLATEGQEATKLNERKRYNLAQFSIPFGFGYKAAINEQWAIAGEFGFRKTFTDYLDDVSEDYVDDQIVGGQSTSLAVALKDRAPEVGLPKFETGSARGNPDNKDWYMIAGVTLTYRIITNKGCFHF